MTINHNRDVDHEIQALTRRIEELKQQQVRDLSVQQIRDRLKPKTQNTDPNEDEDPRFALAQKLWSRAKPIKPDSVHEKYFKQRGITIPLPATIRAGRNEGPYPVILSGLQLTDNGGSDDDQIVALAKTSIKPNGSSRGEPSLCKRNIGSML